MGSRTYGTIAALSLICAPSTFFAGDAHGSQNEKTSVSAKKNLGEYLQLQLPRFSAGLQYVWLSDIPHYVERPSSDTGSSIEREPALSASGKFQAYSFGIGLKYSSIVGGAVDVLHSSNLFWIDDGIVYEISGWSLRPSVSLHVYRSLFATAGYVYQWTELAADVPVIQEDGTVYEFKGLRLQLPGLIQFGVILKALDNLVRPDVPKNIELNFDILYGFSVADSMQEHTIHFGASMIFEPDAWFFSKGTVAP